MRLIRTRQVIAFASGDKLPLGAVVREDRFRPAALACLLACGALSVVATPPLGLVPGWQRRAARLAVRGIESVEAVLALPPAELAALFRLQPATAARWQKELEEHFAYPSPASKG